MTGNDEYVLEVLQEEGLVTATQVEEARKLVTTEGASRVDAMIANKIVDAHDGRIDLSSERGKGTRFRVTLPVSTGSGWFK